MGLFDFFKRAEKQTDGKLADSLVPKTCLTEIPIEIRHEVDKINWADFNTAYGNAKDTIPFYLKNLFCADKQVSMDATHQLWCSLCHQHAYISTAALPSYDILKIGLLTLDEKLKIELLDIFQGFSECTSDKYFAAVKQPPSDWEQELKQKMILDLAIFNELTKHTDEEISAFAFKIVDDLTSAE